MKTKNNNPEIIQKFLRQTKTVLGFFPILNTQYSIRNTSAGSPSITFTTGPRARMRTHQYTVYPNVTRGGISKSGAGFTLIETFIAIAVLLLAIAGPLTIASRGLLSAAFSRDQITAYYLAQEAVELIRNERDHNILSSQESWIHGFDTCLTENGCYIDAADTQFNSCGETCPPLNRDSVGYYSYRLGGSASPFTRTIIMRHVPFDDPTADEISVAVTISWQTGPLAKTFTIQDNFLNWQ